MHFVFVTLNFQSSLARRHRASYRAMLRPPPNVITRLWIRVCFMISHRDVVCPSLPGIYALCTVVCCSIKTDNLFARSPRVPEKQHNQSVASRDERTTRAYRTTHERCFVYVPNHAIFHAIPMVVWWYVVFLCRCFMRTKKLRSLCARAFKNSMRKIFGSLRDLCVAWCDVVCVCMYACVFEWLTASRRFRFV